MTAKTLSSYSMLPACPATDALRIVESSKGKRRSHGFDVTLSSSLFELNFAEATVDSFPSIEWDSDDDVNSFSSLRSLETLTSHGSMSSLGTKRARSSDDHSSCSSRRLVRSRKIKSGLSSLAIRAPMTVSAAS